MNNKKLLAMALMVMGSANAIEMNLREEKKPRAAGFGTKSEEQKADTVPASASASATAPATAPGSGSGVASDPVKPASGAEKTYTQKELDDAVKAARKAGIKKARENNVSMVSGFESKKAKQADKIGALEAEIGTLKTTASDLESEKKALNITIGDLNNQLKNMEKREAIDNEWRVKRSTQESGLLVKLKGALDDTDPVSREEKIKELVTEIEDQGKVRQENLDSFDGLSKSKLLSPALGRRDSTRDLSQMISGVQAKFVADEFLPGEDDSVEQVERLGDDMNTLIGKIESTEKSDKGNLDHERKVLMDRVNKILDVRNEDKYRDNEELQTTIDAIRGHREKLEDAKFLGE